MPPDTFLTGPRRGGPLPGLRAHRPVARRSRRVAALALAGALVAAGCGGSDEGADPAAPPSAAELPPCPVDALDDAAGPVEVLLWYQLNGKPREVLLAQVEKYNASQAKVTVRAENQGADYTELFDAYKRGIPSNQLPDIAVMDETALRYLVDSDTVVAAQTCFEASGQSTDGFNQAALAQYRLGDVLYPGSASLNSVLTYYNKTHFSRAGLDPAKAPATLAEVRDHAEKLKAAGVTDRPVTMKLASWFLESQLTGARQPLVDNDNGRGDGPTTEATFDTATTTQIYEWVQGMVRDGLLNAKADTPGQFEHLLAMANQEASITIETSTAVTTIAAVLGGDTSVGAEAGVEATTNLTQADVGVGPLFGVDQAGRIQIGGNAFYMTNTGADADIAGSWDFLTWWNQPDQQMVWHMEGSYLPFLNSVGEDPAVQAFWRDDFAGQMLKVAFDQNTQGIDASFPGPAIGPYREVRTAIQDSLDQVGLAGGEPGPAIDRAVEQVDAALATYNEGL